MRQQLRLNVLIPVAVLGLLGAGFGAYAMGGAPGTGPVAAPVTTTAPAAPAAPANPAKAPKPGAVTAEAWATGANELCGQAGLEAQVVGTVQTRKQLVQTFARINKFYAFFNARLAALGWPQGKRATVLELQAQYRRAARTFRRAHRALRNRAYIEATEIMDEAAKVDYNDRKVFRRLGATVCASRAAKALANAQATDSLEWMLLRYRTVVVVFYSPKSSVDNEAIIEARAGALDAGAGFVAVNVKREAQVAALSIGYQVLGTPSVLVFVRGPKLKSHFSGIVDRVTVAQAVTNARR
jgi:hypothetical protein